MNYLIFSLNIWIIKKQVVLIKYLYLIFWLNIWIIKTHVILIWHMIFRFNIWIIKSIKHSDFTLKLQTNCLYCDSACIDRAFRQGAQDTYCNFPNLLDLDSYQNTKSNSSWREKMSCLLVRPVIYPPFLSVYTNLQNTFYMNNFSMKVSISLW